MSYKETKTRFSKKLISIIAALCMVFSMMPIMSAYATTATPLETTKAAINVSGLNAGDTVSAYRVVETTYDSSTNNLTSKFAADYGVDFDSYAAYESSSADAKAATDKIAAYIKTHNVAPAATSGAADASGNVTIPDMELGQYLLVVNPSGNQSTKVYTNTIGNVLPTIENGSYKLADATVNVKSTDVTVSKTTSDNKTSDSKYKVGDTVTFVVSISVPSYPADATNTTMIFKDTMTQGLTYNNDFALYSDAECTTAIAASAYSDATVAGTTIAKNIDYASVKQYSTVYVKYTATINSNATTASAETNSAALTFSSNPYSDSNYDTDPSEVTLTTYGVRVTSKDENGDPLPGAAYDIYATNSDGTKGEKVGTLTIDPENGAVSNFDDLGVGTYVLVETTTPSGYQKANDVTVQITEEGGVVTIGGTSSEVDFINSSDPSADGYHYVPVSIGHAKVPVLPLTGDAGTLVLTIVGVIMMVSALTLVVCNRRNRKQQQ